jgi:hypothetical protein
MRTYKKHRKAKKTRRVRKQRGSGVQNFQVYVFTKTPLSGIVKQQLFQCLNSLYNESVEEITDYSSFPNDIFKEDITSFVYSKKKYYPSLKSITGFSIHNIPTNLNSGVMTDPKLTKQEYAIRDALEVFDVPLKLVQVPHGLWNEGVALIALESK